MPNGTHPRHLKWLLPLGAFLALTPLILHGGSCGQDQVFHIQSWLDAAQQLRHGHYPHWANTAAWNAGEPRFLFYPPLSWLLGALLTILFPAQAAPIVYIFLALTAAGLAFYKLASRFVTPDAALIASAFYLANPYMLFNAFERSAYAELLAAAWIPLLLLAVLRSKPTVRGIAVPLALLWLTNAPAAVIGSYTLALLAILRVALSLFIKQDLRHPERSAAQPNPYRQTICLALTYLTSTVLGLALPAFYLIPAASERKYVQVAMAIIPNMRYQDNFLFTRTADAAHNAVNHTISALALTLLALTVAAISAISLLHANSVISTEAQRSGETPVFANLTTTLALLTAIITFLLVPISSPIWQHLPELAFLQFPWRLLTLLAPILAFVLAAILGGPSLRGFIAKEWARFATVILPLALGTLCFHLYAQVCDPNDRPANIAQLLATHHGLGPTDEYTPTDADNDYLRTDNPAYWLAAGPNSPAPNTTPTATELHPDILTDDNAIPVEQTVSTPVPRHFAVHTNSRGYLILNLRYYPNWQIAIGCETCITFQIYKPVQRDDGLTVIALDAPLNGTIDIIWHSTPDQLLGTSVTVFALLVLLCETWLTRRTLCQSP